MFFYEKTVSMGYFDDPDCSCLHDKDIKFEEDAFIRKLLKTEPKI